MPVILPTPELFQDWKSFATALIEELDKILVDVKDNPVHVLANYGSQNLPKASATGGLIYLLTGDLNMPTYSDGSNWRRITDGSKITTPFAQLKMANYTMVQDDTIIVAGSVSAETTITLPGASVGKGKLYSVKRKFDTFFRVIVKPPATEKLDGDTMTTLTLDEVNEAASFFSDGTEWYIV